MSDGQWEAKVIPAQLSFLAIYSPSLGPTDETFHDQILYYYSKPAQDSKTGGKKKKNSKDEQDILKEAENEKLRQIGLAQGMVDFARSFSNGEPVDSVETEKSRIVIRELEKGWWILASIDLTRLPSTSSIASRAADAQAKYEYSAREVSPPALLGQQLLTAHRIFQLHHGHLLQELFYKLKREKFCSTLDRFWSRFCRTWEVLLHGSPAVDVFGGLKLSSGGELGFGVGEEEWGSGERDVLEDLARRTNGLVDLTVSRFGEPVANNKSIKSMGIAEDEGTYDPWSGCGHLPEAHDGVIFGGIGAISRPCLRDVTTWVQQVYTDGDYAYGVRDNPHRQRRKRQRRNPPTDESINVPATVSNGEDLRKQTQKSEAQRQQAQMDTGADSPRLPALPHDPRPAMHDRVASHDHATGSPGVQAASHPGIPPPIVTAAEQALNKATSRADRHDGAEADKDSSAGSTFGISDKWMKYLTLGLSSGKSEVKPAEPNRPPASRRTTSTTSSQTLRPSKSDENTLTLRTSKPEQTDDLDDLKEVEPMPDGHAAAAQAANQQRQETEGYFLIGYRGDLQTAPVQDQEIDEEQEDDRERMMLRTLQVELARESSQAEQNDDQSTNSSQSVQQEHTYERLQVLIYVRRPFIYTFLFEQRTPSLQISSFYKELHQHLVPLHKAMLSNTSIANVARRVAQSHTSPPEPESISTENPPYGSPEQSPVFDLVWDPVLLTVHTSIPNIPQPGTLAAEGFGTTSSGRNGPPAWTRIEGLNVHSQILNTLDSSKRMENEIERTSKTSRGWWVVWLRIPPFADSNAAQGQEQPRRKARGAYKIEQCKVAFLVRKTTDYVAPKSMSSRVSSGMFGFGKGEESSARSQPDSTTTSLVGGLGIDARRYVESLLSLNR